MWISTPLRTGLYNQFKSLGFHSVWRNRAAMQHVCHLEGSRTLVDSTLVYMTEASVDLTLRLNLLAVLAAIVFVSAVLLGAF